MQGSKLKFADFVHLSKAFKLTLIRNGIGGDKFKTLMAKHDERVFNMSLQSE